MRPTEISFSRAIFLISIGLSCLALLSISGARAATVPLELPQTPQTQEQPRPPKPKAKALPRKTEAEKPRFSKAANGVITDARTGLQWLEGPDKETTWEEAKAWIESLDVDGGGWRMPTLKEMDSLDQKDNNRRREFFIDPHFQTIGSSIWRKGSDWSKGCWVWSIEAKDSECFWNYDFRNGEVHLNHRLDHFWLRALAVRSARP